MNKIKIGYFADGPWSHLAFEKIIQDPEIDVKFIVPRNDTKDETLKNYSLKYNIDYLFPVKINSTEFLKEIKKYDCDLFVSLSLIKYLKVKLYQFLKLELLIAMQVNYLFSAEEIS